MKRAGPIVRTAKPMKRSRLARRGVRARRDADALLAFRTVIYARCGCNKRHVGKCEQCGERRLLDPHHIVGRGRAADWPRKHDPELNGLGVCRRCHDELTKNPRFAGARFERAQAALRRWRATSTRSIPKDEYA